MASTTTADDGTWSIDVVRTQALGHSVTFQFEMPLGNSQSTSRKYAAVIPDAATANFSDLVNLSTGSAILAASPSTDALPEGTTNLYFTAARAKAAISATAPLVDTAGVLSIPKATASVDGYLSAADFATFSNPVSDVTSVNGQTGAVVLAKSDVGLGSVDNTSDAAKPISTATQTALDAKQDALGFTAVPNTRTVAGHALSANVTISASDVGLGNVDNTSDASKPVSTATQTALDGKQTLDATLTALAALDTTAGILAQTGTDTFAKRTLTAGSSKLAVTNGDGVSGNPTVDVTEANLTVSNMGGTLAIGHGGTGQTTKAAAFDALSPMTTAGDIIYGGTSGTGTRLAKGSDGNVLTLASGVPSWAAPSGGGGGQLLGYVDISSVTSDGWTRTGTSLGAFSAATAATYSAVGLASAPSTNIAGIKISSIPAGAVKVVVEGISFYTGNSSSRIVLGINDGTNTFGQQAQYNTGSFGGAYSNTATFVYGSTQTNLTFQLYGASSNGLVELEGPYNYGAVTKCRIAVYWFALGY